MFYTKMVEFNKVYLLVLLVLTLNDIAKVKIDDASQGQILKSIKSINTSY